MLSGVQCANDIYEEKSSGSLSVDIAPSDQTIAKIDIPRNNFVVMSYLEQSLRIIPLEDTTTETEPEPATYETTPTVFTEAPETTAATENTSEEATEPPETIPEANTDPTEAPSETEPIDETTETTESSTVNDEAAELLAIVIYQEAGSDSICDDCRRRVGDVVLNRVASDRFPDSIYGVLTQQSQYGSFCYTGVVWPSRASYSGEAHAVERARQIAREILNGQHSELYGNGYVWQAQFVQGSSGFWCCGTYFGKD